MNAAQKAWATRRARAAAAAPFPAAVIAAPAMLAKPAPIVNRDFGGYVPTVYVAPVLEPVTELEVVDIWLDHPVVGCGNRRYVVLAKSRRDVQLFYVPRLTTITISREEFDKAHMPGRKVRPKVIAQIVRDKLAMVDKINSAASAEVMTDGGADTVRVLELLAMPRKRV